MPSSPIQRRAAQMFIVVAAAFMALPGMVWGAPAVGQLSVRGITVGRPTLVVVEGSDLLPDLRLLATSATPIASQVVRPGASANRVELEVTLAGESQVGIFPFRLATSTGVSAPLDLAVDHLVTVPFGPTIESLPIALQGNCSGPQVVKTTFNGRKGQRVVLDVQAARIGSTLKPVVRLYSSRGTQLVWSPPKLAIGGDARAAG